MNFPYTDKAAYVRHIREVIDRGPFSDNWESLTEFEMPRWFEKAKFGIFIHWGLYSVPAYSNEWYSRNMYIEGSPEYEHHIKTYGPHKDFGYKDFIPMFKAEKFDPNVWADTFRNAGAKYVVPVAEHHDGFQMYESSFSHFNAAEMGPKRDVIGELKEAVEDRGMVFGTSSHRAEHHWFMGGGKHFDSDIKDPLVCGDFYWPSEAKQPAPSLADIYYEPAPDDEFLTDWLCRTCEIIDRFAPRVLYFDWWIQHNAYKPYLRMIAAYYYNSGKLGGYDTAICYKHDAMAFGSAIVDMERGKFAEAMPWHWQTDTAIARNSWCYTTSLEYKSADEIICYLADVVSKNGNLLLNVGPKPDGSFADEDAAILRDIGNWLKVNGEAIYGTKPWRVSGEGPTKEVCALFSDGKATEYTSEDLRFTAGNGAVYIISLNYPANGEILVRSMAYHADDNTKSKFHGIITDISVLGFDEKPQYRLDEEGLHIKTTTVQSNLPAVVKLNVN